MGSLTFYRISFPPCEIYENHIVWLILKAMYFYWCIYRTKKINKQLLFLKIFLDACRSIKKKKNVCQCKSISP